MKNKQRPILGIAAFSGTGKTTLLTQLIPWLRQQGLKVALIKHTHHGVDMDKPGKDTYRAREAGAHPVILASGKRWALMEETPEQQEPDLDNLLKHLQAFDLDLVLVEGMKHAAIPKIELHRPELGQPRLYPDDEQVIAVACNAPLNPEPKVPVLDLDQVAEIGLFIQDFVKSS
ncbi:molybdopterin-guanine dinucleotide biosynthesis protein B [Candidatus Venteria ishoeyi]|uniref:Molybdopterin-guanine dinucleotide biosynthesis adapter protein n=1 Tax=Candidatus Venteria ishoeyi TaxID=1899563 RepID=A0A1H6F5S8_9GAMM|nr:molybdopterin-guanine dinucleotide biosynthesis protein B [Candidatus Venteria ishoeyi]MDM8545425.1 molybdopterin-guanine dinucleotide biosynthesis protein B [Candidatus Venteria ishoeyi]SEH04639.1 Molybdopterin-guanine dinucleotide biosynthesis adapter protein [Candidatus Venteria ishoeyi]